MIEEIKSRVEAALEGAEVTVAGADGRFQIEVVSDAFQGLGRVKRQRAVYAAIRDLISSGSVHAVNIRAVTRAELD